MSHEILSIETTKKIARLEKEAEQYEKIISNFDTEVNRLFNIIKEAYEYVNKELTSLEESQKEILKNILIKGFTKFAGETDG